MEQQLDDLPDGLKGVLNVSGGIVTLGLPPPPLGPESSGQWYHDAATRLPATVIEGWFGTIIGSAESDAHVQLFLHEGNHLEPTLRLVIAADQLTAIFIGIGKLLHERLGVLAEWNVKQLESPNGAATSDNAGSP